MRLDYELDNPALLEFQLTDGRMLGTAIGELALLYPEPIAALRTHAAEWPIGWLDLPTGGPTVEASRQLADALCNDADTLVVCGIGGSALGAQAVLQCLDLPGQRLRRIVFIDNLDPCQQAFLLEQVDLTRCALNVISKSGGTLETMASFLYVLDHMQRSGISASELKRRVVATTDEHTGVLRQYATEQGWATLPVPNNVGGRFSVFTPVGLLPLAFAGVDIDALLAGAHTLQQHTVSQPTAKNPAWRLAATHYLLHTNGGIHDTVQYIYGDPLVLLGDWFKQLWAESLAKAIKTDGSASGIGQTPVIARGSTDQHSQNQLFMEGPNDKLFTFITCKEWPVDPVALLPDGAPAESFSSFAGKRFGELLDACRCGTRDALVEAGRPACEIILSDLSAESTGAYLQLWMLATGYAGLLYGVNPFDQPGVERSKQIAKARLAGG